MGIDRSVPVSWGTPTFKNVLWFLTSCSHHATLDVCRIFLCLSLIFHFEGLEARFTHGHLAVLWSYSQFCVLYHSLLCSESAVDSAQASHMLSRHSALLSHLPRPGLI